MFFLLKTSLSEYQIIIIVLDIIHTDLVRIILQHDDFLVSYYIISNYYYRILSHMVRVLSSWKYHKNMHTHLVRIISFILPSSSQARGWGYRYLPYLVSGMWWSLLLCWWQHILCTRQWPSGALIKVDSEVQCSWRIPHSK